MKIFYSWQSDTDIRFNKEFIKDCLEATINGINEKLQLDEAIRLDHDKNDIPGSPDIVHSLLNKISKSQIFIGDLTFIGNSYSKTKKLPNPNVLFELGYALCHLTDKCIVNVMNTVYGSPEKNMPFDLANRKWPILYGLDESNYNSKDEIKKKLSSEFLEAIHNIVKIQGSTNRVVPINELPTIHNIQKHIKMSDPKIGWHIIRKRASIIATYKNDPQLRIELDISKDEHEEDFLMHAIDKDFPDKNILICPCDIYVGSSLVYRTYLAWADNKKVIIPKPIKFENQTGLFSVDIFDYKLAKIFNRDSLTREYLIRYKIGIET